MLNNVIFFLSFLLLIFSNYLILKKYLVKYLGSDNEIAFVSLCFSFLYLCILSYVLMLLSIFNLINVSILIVAAILINITCGRVLKNYNRINLPRIKFGKYSILAMLIMIISFSINIMYPTQYLLGGRDTGLYTVFGVHIAQTGGLDLNDQLLEKIYPFFIDSIKISYPGIYSALARSLSSSSGDLIPQFAHLFPSILAVGYKVAGLTGLFSVNAFISFLSLGSIYLFVKKIVNKKTAIIAIIFLAVNPAQIWAARITLTETLSQFLLFFSMYILYIAIKSNKLFPFFISSIVLGISGFNRIDSHILIAGVFAFTLFHIITGKNVKAGICYFLTYFTLSAISLYYLYKNSYPYFHDLWLRNLDELVYLNILCLLVICCSLFTYFIIKRHSVFKPFILKFMKLFKRKGSTLSSLILIILIIIGLFMRPYLFLRKNDNIDVNSMSFFNANALEQFCWYVPLMCLLLGIIGINFLIKRKSTVNTLFFLITGLAGTIAYILRPSITPDHIWASRRWIPISIPFVIILSAIGITFMIKKITNKKLKISIMLICFIYVVSFSINQAMPFIAKPMLNGYTKGYRELIEYIPEDAIVFTTSQQIASPLKYIYNRNTYIVDDADKFSQDIYNYLVGSNEQVYYLGDISKIKNNNLSQEYLYTSEIKGEYLEKLKGSFPQETYERNQINSLYKVYCVDDKVIKTYTPSYPFYSENGTLNNDNELLSNGKAGYLVYGPYIKLSEGHYKVTIYGEAKKYSNNEIGKMDVVSDKGKRKIAEIPIHWEDISQMKMSIEFELEDAVDDIEFRVNIHKDVFIKISTIVVEKQL